MLEIKFYLYNQLKTKQHDKNITFKYFKNMFV